MPCAAGETRVRLHSHKREPERAVQALARGIGGGHHAVDHLYARKTQKLDERGVQAASCALALRGGRKVDGKLGVPLEGDAFAQLMGVGEPDDASALLGDETGVLLADLGDALVRDSRVSGITFTGSTTVGRQMGIITLNRYLRSEVPSTLAA